MALSDREEAGHMQPHPVESSRIQSKGFVGGIAWLSD